MSNYIHSSYDYEFAYTWLNHNTKGPYVAVTTWVNKYIQSFYKCVINYTHPNLNIGLSSQVITHKGYLFNEIRHVDTPWSANHSISVRKDTPGQAIWHFLVQWHSYMSRDHGPDSIWRCYIARVGNPIVETRQWYGRRISTIGFPILVW